MVPAPRRRRQDAGAGAGAGKRKRSQPFRAFFSRLALPRPRFPGLWPFRRQAKEALPERLHGERFSGVAKGIGGWVWKWRGLIWRWSKPALPVLILAHLGLIALFPGGANRLFDVKIGAGPNYLTPFQMIDALGFEQRRDGFLVYKIYAQSGALVRGVYPDDTVLPRLRQKRWAAAGHAFSGPYPMLHRLVLERLLERLPAPPVRLEIFSARYQWDRDSLTFPWPGKGPRTTLKMTRLGVYTGFSRQWKTDPGPGEAFAP